MLTRMTKFILRIKEGIYAEFDATTLKEAKKEHEKLVRESEKIILDVQEEKPLKRTAPKGLHEQLLRLKEEEFFSSPRSVTEIREKLKEYAAHYPPTAFPPYLQRIVQQRVLRRFKEKRDKKELWVYVNL